MWHWREGWGHSSLEPPGSSSPAKQKLPAREGQELISNCGTNNRPSPFQQGERQGCPGPLPDLLGFPRHGAVQEAVGSTSSKRQKSLCPVCGWGHFYTLLSAGHVPLQLGSSSPFLSGLWMDGPLSDAAIYSSSNTQVIRSGLFQELTVVHSSPALLT